MIAVANSTIKFVPNTIILGNIPALPLYDTVKHEPMFYQSSISYVREHGGPLAQEFLNFLGQSFTEEKTLIDVRTHHLQKGYYPAIPGYHLDWIGRKNKGIDPDLSEIPNYEHIIYILGETSLTEYVDGPILLDLPENDAFTHADRAIRASDVPTWSIQNGQVVYFTSHDWHRPTAAEGPEWRFFIRASRLDGKRKPVNEIRTQSQVYIPIQGE